ncbi:uncharacterized protein LOC128234104 isoform X1 [Mya arenaria]|uniref:uncharacterized protein LOC128234104 isoform X1 n=1 Tax=Mya arenaria TaxID=6604 RepID=UPI0022E0BB74|nr:uncharacterized protein LOC128234104 isoform X1 [Mya arenaria]
MMAALMGRTEVGVKKFGGTVTIPDDPKARLMYYLDCVCVILDMSATANLAKLRNYKQYNMLTEAETDALVSLCFLLSPDELNDKVMILDDAMCGDSPNAFYEISAVRHNLLVTNSILIGGQQRAVSKIMVYKRQWVLNYWITPMEAFAGRLARIATGGAAPQQWPAITYNQPATGQQRRSDTGNDCCCTIL